MEQREMVVTGLNGRYKECISEKNCTLIRYDIIQDLKNLYDVVPDEAKKALALIEIEEDLKYRKKYATVWREKKKMTMTKPRIVHRNEQPYLDIRTLVAMRQLPTTILQLLDVIKRDRRKLSV